MVLRWIYCKFSTQSPHLFWKMDNFILYMKNVHSLLYSTLFVWGGQIWCWGTAIFRWRVWCPKLSGRLRLNVSRWSTDGSVELILRALRQVYLDLCE